VVEECQVDGAACVGSHLLDIVVCWLWMRPAWMVEMHWLKAAYSTRAILRVRNLAWAFRFGDGAADSRVLVCSFNCIQQVNERSVFILE
jgi:hypothetical protein